MQDKKNLHIEPIDSDDTHITINDWEKDVCVDNGSLLKECLEDISTDYHVTSNFSVMETPGIAPERDRMGEKTEERVSSKLTPVNRDISSLNGAKQDAVDSILKEDENKTNGQSKTGGAGPSRGEYHSGNKRKFSKWIIWLICVMILACGFMSIVNRLGNKDNSSSIGNPSDVSTESVPTNEEKQETENNIPVEETESSSASDTSVESESTKVDNATHNKDQTATYIWDFSKSIAEFDNSKNHGNIEIIETNYGVHGALLDGDEDYIECGTGMNLSDSWSFHTAFSCYDVDKNYSTFFAKYETNHYGPYGFSVNHGHVNCWFSEEANNHTELESVSSISNGEWVDVIVTKEKSTVCLYVNGILEGKEDINCITNSSDMVTIGRQALMFEPYDQLQFTGIIADISVYDKVLPYEEIKQLSDKTHEVSQNAAAHGSNNNSVGENSDSYIWDFEKSLSDFADLDSKFQGNIEMIETDTGIRGILLDGDEDYIECGTGMNLSDSWSFHAAFSCYDVDKNYSTFYAKYETDHYGPYGFSVNHGHVNCWFSEEANNHTELESVSSISNGEWVDVIVTKEKNIVCLYVNGILEGKEDVNCITDSSDMVTIGRQALMFEPYDQLQFTGIIADISVYDKVLPYEEIKLLSDKTLTISNN